MFVDGHNTLRRSRLPAYLRTTGKIIPTRMRVIERAMMWMKRSQAYQLERVRLRIRQVRGFSRRKLGAPRADDLFAWCLLRKAFDVI